MSCDFGVWFPHERLSADETGKLYGCICEGNASAVAPHPAVDAFYLDLTSRYPEIDTIPEDRIDDFDYCPWSGALDRSPGHVVMSCVWSKAEDVRRLVYTLAAKHGLVVFDPQASHAIYPDERWKLWKLSCEEKADVPLAPNYAFLGPLGDLDAHRNSFYVLEHLDGNYMQCGGSRQACTVEFRVYSEGGIYNHYVVGHSTGSDTPVEIEMSAGGCNVLEREVLNYEKAAALFAAFFAGEPLPVGYSVRERDL